MLTAFAFAGRYKAMSVGHVPVKAARCCLTNLFLLVNALATQRKALQQCHTSQKPIDMTIKAQVARFKKLTGTELPYLRLPSSSVQLLLHAGDFLQAV